jgi:hypothetical protein
VLEEFVYGTFGCEGKPADLVTYPVKQSPSWEADRFSACQHTAPSAIQPLQLTSITGRHFKQDLLQNTHFHYCNSLIHLRCLLN